MAEQEEPDDDSEGLRELLGDGPIPFPERTERAFQPWHRPRKQYVRDKQWSREVGMLARDLELAEGELRYLTLPGNDLLDIRQLAAAVCIPRNLRLRYLGFNTAATPNSAAQPELNSTQFSINRLEYIHPESEVFPGDFRLVGNSKSIQWQRVRRAGPFHVINLDLCSGFAGEERSEDIPNYFTALQALLQNQASSEEEFLLLVTSRMDAGSTEAASQAAMIDLAMQLHDACGAYADAFAEFWGERDGVPTISTPAMLGEAEGFMIGLTQWIVSRAINVGLKASVKSLMTYRTGSGAGEDDLVSLAIRFKPDPYLLEDPHGLVRPIPPQRSIAEKECAQSAIIPRRVAQRVRVDEVLRTQSDAFERCLRESIALLVTAGYDPDLYQEWVMTESDRYASG